MRRIVTSYLLPLENVCERRNLAIFMSTKNFTHWTCGHFTTQAININFLIFMFFTHRLFSFSFRPVNKFLKIPIRKDYRQNKMKLTEIQECLHLWGGGWVNKSTETIFQRSILHPVPNPPSSYNGFLFICLKRTIPDNIDPTLEELFSWRKWIRLAINQGPNIYQLLVGDNRGYALASGESG